MTSLIHQVSQRKEVAIQEAAIDLNDYCSFIEAQLDLDDYTSFLQTYSTSVLSQLRIERDDSLFTWSNMSNIQSTFQSKSYSSSTFTSSRDGEAPQTWRSTESTSSNPQGTTIHRTSEQPGQLPTQEKLQLDSHGKPVLGQQEERGKIEDVSEVDREYLERMEDEYAKREGGA